MRWEGIKIDNMIHARKDYNRIQDPENKIPENEPVFLLRGQDELAPDTLRQYAEFCFENKRLDVGEKAMKWAEEMELYQAKFKKKLPDL